VAVIDSVQFLPQQRSRHQIARVMAAARQITRLLGTEAGDERPASARQPVVKVRRRTGADEAPGSQGAKRENTGSI
jgi:hypothetical protein